MNSIMLTMLKHLRKSRTMLFLLAFLPRGAAADPVGGEVTGRVVVLDGGTPKSDASEVVLYLRGAAPNPDENAGVVVRVTQREKQFRPKVAVVPIGGSVEFPNEDNIFHNVFSLSRVARFDLGLYKSGDHKTVKAKRAGVIDVFCNIHPQMAAKILVVESRYYVRAEKDGRFSIPNVPPGNYELVAWQPWGSEAKQKIVVSKGKRSEASFKLAGGTETREHTRKDGTPYGRYE